MQEPRTELTLKRCRVDCFEVSRSGAGAFDLVLRVTTEETPRVLLFRNGRNSDCLADLLEATSLNVTRSQGQLAFGAIQLEFHDLDLCFHEMTFDAWRLEIDLDRSDVHRYFALLR